MRELGREKRRLFYRRFLHQTLRVLMEDLKEKARPRWKGLSRNYIPVSLSGGEGLALANREVEVAVTGWSDQGVVGHLVEGTDG